MSDLLGDIEAKLKEVAINAIETDCPQKFHTGKHVAFLIRHLNVFPEAYISLDTNRITLLFFAISSLDLLGQLDHLLTPERRQQYIDWIYTLQLTKGIPYRFFKIGKLPPNMPFLCLLC